MLHEPSETPAALTRLQTTNNCPFLLLVAKHLFLSVHISMDNATSVLLVGYSKNKQTLKL